MAGTHIAAALLLLIAAHQASAWSKPNCEDVIVGESNTLGITGEGKPMEKVDHTQQWRKFGQITKLNLYYSWNYGCLQGIKATYGYKAGNALLIGHEKNLYTQHLMLKDYEHVVKADWRQEPSGCIQYIKLYTDKGKSLTFGNKKSKALFQSVEAPKNSWLAALRGEHDIDTVDGRKVQAGLQNLVFVWAEEQCPTLPQAQPVPKPDTPEDPTLLEGSEQPEPEVPEVTSTPQVPETPLTQETPEVPEVPEVREPSESTEVLVEPVVPYVPVTPAAGVCPPVPAMCAESAAEGDAGFCPVTSSFTAPKCEGGCCVSSGKCKMPLCKLNGLGADVIALDFICYGKNNGPFGGLNKCRNLACKLAVPGCQSGLLGGNCIGTVEAANDNLDDMAKQYIGKPCIEVVNHPSPVLHMPLNKPGLPVPNGEYMGGLWSVCDCMAQPSPILPAVPIFDLKKPLLGKMHPKFAALVAGATDDTCYGPMCALLPQLPVLNASLPDLQIPMTLLANLTALLKPKPLPNIAPLAGVIPAIELPSMVFNLSHLTLPDLPTFDDCANFFINITNTLKPAIELVVPQPLSPQELIKLVSNLLPQIRFELPTLDIQSFPKVPLPDLASLVNHMIPRIPEIRIQMPELKLPQLPEIRLQMPEFKLPQFNSKAQQNETEAVAAASPEASATVADAGSLAPLPPVVGQQ